MEVGSSHVSQMLVHSRELLSLPLWSSVFCFAHAVCAAISATAAASVYHPVPAHKSLTAVPLVAGVTEKLTS